MKKTLFAIAISVLIFAAICVWIHETSVNSIQLTVVNRSESFVQILWRFKLADGKVHPELGWTSSSVIKPGASLNTEILSGFGREHLAYELGVHRVATTANGKPRLLLGTQVDYQQVKPDKVIEFDYGRFYDLNKSGAILTIDKAMEMNLSGENVD